MLTQTIDVQHPQANLQEILSLVRKGTEVVLTEGDKPLARLIPMVTPTRQRVAGLHSQAIWTSDDFDEPLADEFWIESQ